MKSKTTFTLLIIALFIASFVPVLNNEICTYASSKIYNTSSSQHKVHSVYRSEQKVWKYRTVNGKVQKRLWSKTYNKWLTDWEWI
ncbi:MAG: hypothetical protein E7222_09065 [Clostridiales bacterium]|nr:hypothetical protein [Clostridiales bacterium]